MINVDENYRLVQDLLSKNNGVYITPEEYNRYAELASNDLFDKLVGAKNNNSTAYGINRTLDRRLMPFRRVDIVPVVGGVANEPADSALIRSVYYFLNGTPKPLRVVDEDRFAKLFDDPFAKPTEEEPVYIEDNLSIRVYPETITELTIEYLKRPVAPVYAYTEVNRRPLYDAVNSINFDWDKREEAELTMRILQYAGVSMTNGQVVQYTEAKQAQE